MFYKKTELGEEILKMKKQLYKDIFPYSEIPKINFNNKPVPMDLPEQIWITDTTFRDGQQSMSSFTVEEIVKLYDYLHELDNGSGIIRQSEFFLYTDKDKEAVKACMARGYKYPEITGWIRATKEDLQLVKDLGIKETGMLMSCSDYHIFDKMGKDRDFMMKSYLDLAEDALKSGINPRCHLEDITRADFDGFVIPLVKGLMKLSKEYDMPVKIRACDTLGLGVPHNGTELPRSVPAIMHVLKNEGGVPSSLLEWHGHNDYYVVVANSTAAWLHGCSSINGAIFGIGERTGNCPLEAMVVEYAQIVGNTKDMDLTVINEMSEYFQKQVGYDMPKRTPYVGEEFNVTRAGIHADGILKNEEIYNSFDTAKILNRPMIVAINEYSGLAGIAGWINSYYQLNDEDKLGKRDERLMPIKEWVDEEYEKGRTTVIRNEELCELMKEVMPEIDKKKQ